MKIKNIILSSKTVLAPLTDFSNHAFRIQCRKYNAALVFTQMFNINALINNFKKFHLELEIHPEEHPIIIQLIGADPKIMAQVMDLLESYNYDGVDLNLGCPSPDAIHSGIGGALLKKPEKIAPIINVLCGATNKTVSAKIRSGFDYFTVNALEVAQMIEKEGADFLTVHGRTVKTEYKGKSNLDIIKLVKENTNIPIIGNGDIIGGPSAEHMLKYTGCDLIMIGRAAMENPKIFLEINSFLSHSSEIQKFSQYD